MSQCYKNHPELNLGSGVLIGGSCSDVQKMDTADICVGLDYGMAVTSKTFPWDPGIQFPFYIRDREAPKSAVEFVALIRWLSEQLDNGQRVHVGCIGGHGRTGMVVAALAKTMLGETDAIAWTRKNYCKSAVETKVQVKFLMDLFSIRYAEPSKKPLAASYGKKRDLSLPAQFEFNRSGWSPNHNIVEVEVTPQSDISSIWTFDKR